MYIPVCVCPLIESYKWIDLGQSARQCLRLLIKIARLLSKMLIWFPCSQAVYESAYRMMPGKLLERLMPEAGSTRLRHWDTRVPLQHGRRAETRHRSSTNSSKHFYKPSSASRCPSGLPCRVQAREHEGEGEIMCSFQIIGSHVGRFRGVCVTQYCTSVFCTRLTLLCISEWRDILAYHLVWFLPANHLAVMASLPPSRETPYFCIYLWN